MWVNLSDLCTWTGVTAVLQVPVFGSNYWQRFGGLFFFLLRIPVFSAGFQLLIQAAISLASAARELGCEQGVACCQPLSCCDHHAAQPLLLPSVSSVVSVEGEHK